MLYPHISRIASGQPCITPSIDWSMRVPHKLAKVPAPAMYVVIWIIYYYYYYYYYLLIGIRKTKSYKNQSQVHLNKIKPAVI